MNSMQSIYLPETRYSSIRSSQNVEKRKNAEVLGEILGQWLVKENDQYIFSIIEHVLKIYETRAGYLYGASRKKEIEKKLESGKSGKEILFDLLQVDHWAKEGCTFGIILNNESFNVTLIRTLIGAILKEYQANRAGFLADFQKIDMHQVLAYYVETDKRTEIPKLAKDIYLAANLKYRQILFAQKAASSKLYTKLREATDDPNAWVVLESDDGKSSESSRTSSLPLP